VDTCCIGADTFPIVNGSERALIKSSMLRDRAAYRVSAGYATLGGNQASDYRISVGVSGEHPHQTCQGLALGPQERLLTILGRIRGLDFGKR
jgi:hypothetical protein